MSRESSADPDPEHVEEAGSDDDELARELELERQKLLAAAASQTNANGNGDRSDSQEYIDDEEDDDEGDIGGDAAQDEDDSGDEWRPPEPAVKATRRSKRRRASSSSQDSDQSAAHEPSDDDLAPATKKPKKTAKPKKTSSAKSDEKVRKPKASAAGNASEAEANQDAEEYDSFDEEAERVQAEVEAAAAWADVRKRKEAAQSKSSANDSTTQPSAASSATKPSAAPSLTAWLGKGPSASSSVSELAASLPMPTTCAAAQIVDRSSLFVGYVYPLTTASSAYISALLSHLTRVVHPTVPVDLLPPQFANAPANKRGSSHDMYAYRVLELKRGRTGLAGPDDFSLQEDKEDDGERWGGDRVLRVARDEGASDVLVVVSRWYGGELLGPVRFEHIENAARAALEEHMAKEEVDEFRQRIQHLDRKIAQAKAGAGGNVEDADIVPDYADLTIERAQRLWLARQKALDALLKRVASQAQQSSQPATSQQDEQAETNTTEEQDEDPAGHSPQASEPEDIAASSPLGQPEAPAPDEVRTKSEPDDTLPLDASPGSDGTANGVQVKPEPGINTSQAQIKSEAVDPTAALRIKPDPDADSALDPGDTQEQAHPTGFTVKSEHVDDIATDLTGWDDL